jgi:glycerol-3-phosphate dehydrogenase
MISAETRISETTFDVIIIGAGINGAGIARDAAMRGLKVLLLDKGGWRMKLLPFGNTVSRA